MFRRQVARLVSTACVGRRWRSMDAFLEFERELARKKRAEAPPQPPKAIRLEPPIKPQDGDCCNMNCPNCVLLVYNEQLLEYEDSLRWANATSDSNAMQKPPMKLKLTYATAADSIPEIEPLPLGVQLSPVVVNDTLASSPSRSVHQLDIDIAPKTYMTAGNAAVHMFNSEDLVDRMLRYLAVDGDVIVNLDHPTKFPRNEWTTLTKLFKWHVDIGAVPKPRLLRQIATYATTTADKDNLLSMAADGSTTFTFLDVLEQHSSVSISLEELLNIAPALISRQYTIASSPAQYPHTVSLLVAAKPLGRCSTYLASNKSSVNVSFSPSSFSESWQDVLKSPSPVLCVATGTGLAPFRGFLQDLDVQKTTKPVALFFGCRDPDVDFLYQSELQGALADGRLSHLFPAFSSGPERQYVQDQLRENAQLVADYLVHQKGSLFVCGSLAMGRDVKHTIVECLAMSLNWSQDKAKEYVAQMSQDKRYISEVW